VVGVILIGGGALAASLVVRRLLKPKDKVWICPDCEWPLDRGAFPGPTCPTCGLGVPTHRQFPRSLP
jgi:rubrerythrin